MCHSGDTYRNEVSYSDRAVAPRGDSNAALAGCKLQELFHRICMSTVSNL